jgi:hypothetical protein
VGPGATLATVTFRAAYGANVHVLLMPRTDAAAGIGAYVTSTGGAGRATTGGLSLHVGPLTLPDIGSGVLLVIGFPALAAAIAFGLSTARRHKQFHQQ